MPPKGFKVITVPEQFHSLVMKLKEKYGGSAWQVLSRFVVLALQDEKEIDRYFWYSFKLVTGWTYVKSALQFYKMGYIPKAIVEGEIERFIKTLYQIKTRTHVNFDGIEKLINELLELEKNPDAWKVRGKKIAEINDMVRELARRLAVFDRRFD